MEYGTGDSRRMIPLHTLHASIGHSLSGIVIKAHMLSGNDDTIKIGTDSSTSIWTFFLLENMNIPQTMKWLKPNNVLFVCGVDYEQK